MLRSKTPVRLSLRTLAFACALTLPAAGQQPPPLVPPASADITPAPARTSPPPAKPKKGYSGPTGLVELPATPIVDQDGQPVLDPGGKPMFHPAVRQMRDKKGHPLFDNKGKPVFQTAQDMGYDDRGKKIAPVKEVPVKAAAIPAPASAPPPAAAAAVATGEAATPDPSEPAQATPTKAAAAPAKVKKGKEIYTGPTTVVELPPTPVLDQEGRQRLDPDGKPMFNAPVKQARDKKGHPIFENGKPVYQTAKDLGYDDKGRKIAIVKEKPPKTVIVNVTHGTFTVDGLTGKAQLNYEIHDLKFFYFYVPWIGTTVVSNSPFPGSKEQKDGFADKTLTVQVEDHTLQLYSDTGLLDKKTLPAYVLVDRDFKLPTNNPTVGFGATPRAPYEWPGAKQDKPQAKASIVAPPLPENMRPQLLLSACPPGQMRKPGPRPLPGQSAQVQPCIPISAAITAPATKPDPAPAATPPPQ